MALAHDRQPLSGAELYLAQPCLLACLPGSSLTTKPPEVNNSPCFENDDHKGPYVGASRLRSWSHLLVLGAISWAFIAKS